MTRDAYKPKSKTGMKNTTGEAHEYLIIKIVSHCGRAESVLDSHRSRVQDPVRTVLSTELPTVDHHDSIKLSVRWCVWKVGEGFPGRVSPKTLKWVAVYSSVTFHING